MTVRCSTRSTGLVYKAESSIKKTPHCNGCGKDGHYSINCTTTARKPLKRAYIKQKTYAEVIAEPKKRKKRSPRQIAKDAAWASFSYYIRIRDSLATTGTISHCVCVTCCQRQDCVPKPFAKIQAGHAVGGRGNAVLFHEELVNGQCDYCNSQGAYGLKGDYGNYALYLVGRYGMEHTIELLRLKGTTLVYKTHDFIEIKEKYDKLAKELLQ